MGVSGDRSLQWEASIATKRLEQDGKNIEATFKKIAQTQVQENQKQIKSIQSLEIKLDSFRAISQKATDPKILREYNIEVQKLEKQIQQLKNVGKEGFDSMGNAIENTTGGVRGMIGTLRTLAASLGVIFGIQQLIEFASELFNIVRKAEGIELAFARIGTAADLQKLREATRGTVGDLQLMQAAVKASNFKIPLDTLGKGLAFAQQRAKDTGQEVDYLVNSLVDGIGRKSTMILDNLGLSVTEVQGEFQKTGDFAVAVGNIIEREMAKSGQAVNTLGESTDKASTSWQNFKLTVADFFRTYFNPNAIDTSAVGKMTEAIRKEIGELDKLSEKQRERELFILQERNKTINEILSGKRGLDLTGYNIPALKEEFQANQNILSLLKQRTAELKEQDRLARDQVSVTEMQAKVEKLRKEAADRIIYGQADRDFITARVKEADELQKKIDDILGKGIEKRQAKEENAYEKSLQLQKSLLDQISKLNDDYSRKGLTKEEQERQAIRDRFKLLKSEITEYNKTAAKGLQIDTAQMDLIQANLIDELLQRQFVENQKVTIAEQKQIFEQFEAYKLEYGVAKARERFAGELAGFKTYIDYLKSLMPDDSDTSAGANALRDYLNKAIPEAQLTADKKAFDDSIKNLKRVLEATKAAKDEELLIEEKYLKDLALLREEYANRPEEFARRAARLKEIKEEAVSQAYDEEIKRTEAYKKATEKIIVFAKAAAREQIANIDKVLDNEKLSEKEREEMLKKRLELQKAIAKFDLETSAAVLGQLSGSLREAAGLIGKFNAEAAKTINTVAELAEGVSGILAGLATGNPFAVISGTIAAASAIYDLIDKSAEKRAANEEKQRQNMERTQAAIEGINRILEQQSKIIDRALGTDRIAAFNRQIKTITSDLLSVIQRINQVDLTRLVDQRGVQRIQKFQAMLKTLNDTLGRQTRSGANSATINTIDEVIEENRNAIESLYSLLEAGQLNGNVDELKELLATYEQLEQQLEDYRNKLKQVITGTTLVSIVDSLADGFKKGYKSAADFADNFEELMKNAVIQSLKMQALEKPLQEFYDQLAVDSESGGSLDSDEIAKLKELYESIIANAGARFEELQQIAGLDFSQDAETAKQGALAGAIRGITADQADLLAGQFNGQRMATLEGVQVAKQQLSVISQSRDMLMEELKVQNMIETNTRQTVQAVLNTNAILSSKLTETNSKLASIDRKADLQADILRAVGG